MIFNPFHLLLSYFPLFNNAGVVLFHPRDRVLILKTAMSGCVQISPFVNEGLFCDRTINGVVDFQNNIHLY